MDEAIKPSREGRVRPLNTEDLRWALAKGWNDFKAKRGDLIILPFIYPLIGIIASVFAFNTNLFPLIFPLAGGFALVGPIAAAGFYELARRREANLDTSWWHFLDPLKGRSRLPIATLTVVLIGLFLAWMMAADAIFTATLGTLDTSTPESFLQNLFTTSQGLTMIIIGNLVGAVFAVITLALAAFSFPMVVDKNIDGFGAMAISIAAFRASPGAMIGWGLRVALILALAALPLFIGLLVALPVLGYATWHLYTRAVVR